MIDKKVFNGIYDYFFETSVLIYSLLRWTICNSPSIDCSWCEFVLLNKRINRICPWWDMEDFFLCECKEVSAWMAY